jgi:hypothetical protein
MEYFNVEDTSHKSKLSSKKSKTSSQKSKTSSKKSKTSSKKSKTSSKKSKTSSKKSKTSQKLKTSSQKSKTSSQKSKIKSTFSLIPYKKTKTVSRIKSNNLDTCISIHNVMKTIISNKRDTPLTQDETKIIDNVSKSLHMLYTNNGLSFNKEAFKKLIQQVSASSNQTGGDKKRLLTITLDFAAIVALFVAIFLFVFAYYELINLASSINLNAIGTNLKDDALDSIRNAIEDLKKDHNNISFLSYFYNIIKNFTFDVSEKQKNHIIDFITKSISNVSVDFKEKVIEHCVTNEDITGYKNIDNVINFLVTSVTSTSVTSQCIITTTQTLTEQYMRNQMTALNLLSTKIITKGSQINNIFQLSATLGVKSIVYLSYNSKRIFGTIIETLRTTNIPNEKKQIKYEEDDTIDYVNNYFNTHYKSSSSDHKKSKKSKKNVWSLW